MPSISVAEISESSSAFFGDSMTSFMGAFHRWERAIFTKRPENARRAVGAELFPESRKSQKRETSVSTVCTLDSDWAD